MVKKYVKCIFGLLGAALLVLCPMLAQASLQATVDRNPVSADESFTLTLQSDGSNASPDLSPLKRDFEILGQSQGSTIQIVNGHTSQSVQWQISLSPKHSGQIVIPAITAGGQSSQPITLNVTAGGQAAAAQGAGNLFVDVSAEPRTAYVQQQIIFTVRLYRAVDLGNGSSLSDPVFPGMDAVVQKLGDDHEFQTVRNGKEYIVIERRYAVYPQKEGSFSSDPVVFNGTVIEASEDDGFFSMDPFNRRARHQRVNSKTVTFTVKPAPAAFDGNQWLPTSRLQLSEQWSQNPPRFTVGEPVTRTLTLQANGLPASALPTIEVEGNDALKLYPDQPTLKDNKNDNGILGAREQKFAVIPTRAGKLNLPPIEVKWWNTATDREEVARLPAREITVQPGAPGASAPLPLPTYAAASSSYESPSATTTLASQMHLSSISAGWWPWLSLLLGLGWLVTLIAWWRARQRAPQAVRAPSRNKTKRATQTGSRSQIENQLKQSCLANDAVQAKAQLLAWAQQRWPEDPPNNLTVIARRCDAALADALEELDRHLYARSSTAWRGDRLWDLFQYHQPASDTPAREEDRLLEPLYRS